jgi:hypothetical protein
VRPSIGVIEVCPSIGPDQPLPPLLVAGLVGGGVGCVAGAEVGGSLVVVGSSTLTAVSRGAGSTVVVVTSGVVVVVVSAAIVVVGADVVLWGVVVVVESLVGTVVVGSPVGTVVVVSPPGTVVVVSPIGVVVVVVSPVRVVVVGAFGSVVVEVESSVDDMTAVAVGSISGGAALDTTSNPSGMIDPAANAIRTSSRIRGMRCLRKNWVIISPLGGSLHGRWCHGARRSPCP